MTIETSHARIRAAAVLTAHPQLRALVEAAIQITLPNATPNPNRQFPGSPWDTAGLLLAGWLLEETPLADIRQQVAEAKSINDAFYRNIKTAAEDRRAYQLSGTKRSQATDDLLADIDLTDIGL